MPSITFWNRLEPRPRAPSLTEPLSARLRDPLWLLTRQWQFGEFHGEDAGSPAFARMDATCVPLAAWRIADEPWRALDGRSPLEPLVEGEPLPSDDLSLQVELAQEFGTRLRAQQGMTNERADAVIAAFRQVIPLAAPAPADADATRFYLHCAPRSFDGVLLWRASLAAPPALPPGAVIDPAAAGAVQAAQAELAGWVRDTFGTIGREDPPAWREQRLEYEASLSAVGDDGTRLEFRASPELDGDVDWYALDLVPNAAGAPPPARATTTLGRSVMPTHVRFRGMPNARWWDFENGRMDFGDLRPDTREVAKLVVMDFMLIHGNDWFVIPVEQPVGSVCRVSALSVRDVFGGLTHVERSEASDQLAGGSPWTLFSIASSRAGEARAEYLVLPPSVSAALQTGPALEEVRFFRDESANLVWAVERTLPGGAGEPWPGAERSVASLPPPVVGGPPAGPSAPLRYTIQTEVPYHWIPFLPVSIDPARGDIALERAAVLDTRVVPARPIHPAGRILRPRDGAAPYRVREEEVTRAGVVVRRVACRSRWVDGSTWLWVARQKLAGAGEGSSGLRYDGATAE